MFSELINKEYLDKYAWRIHKNLGIVDKGGKVDFEKMKFLYERVDGESYPNRFTYYLIHGNGSIASPWYIGKYKGNEDELYKECLRKNVTWEELLDFKHDDKVLY